MRDARPSKQPGEVVVHAGHPKIRFPLKRLAQVVDLVPIIVQEFDDGEDEVVRLVEGVEDLVACHGDGRGARDATLHLDEAQLAGAGDAALDVVTELVEFPVGGVEAKACLLYTSDAADE